MATISRISTKIPGRHKERRKKRENKGKVRGKMINVTRLAKNIIAKTRFAGASWWFRWIISSTFVKKL